MSALLRIACASAWNRRLTLALMAISIALSSFLLLGVTRVREDAQAGLRATVSGTDLIVGARGSGLSLLLYSVFHLGEPTRNIDWTSALWLATHPAVAWSVPVSLGDSWQGFPVIGTVRGYFSHVRQGQGQLPRFTQGRVFGDVFEAVLGAEAAAKSGLGSGAEIVLRHGMGLAGADHADKPFRVVGVLAPSGTPADRSVFIGLDGMEAIHLDWQAGMPLKGSAIGAGAVRKFSLVPHEVTGVLVGLKSRAHVFAMQREIAAYRDEALMGVLPGIELDRLGELTRSGERALFVVSLAVAAVGLAGLIATLLAGLDARRRELAILRAVGAGPRHILLLLVLEGGLVSLAGALAGWLALCIALGTGAPALLAATGIVVRPFALSAQQAGLLVALVVAGLLASLVPAIRAYSLSLADGLSPKL